MDKIRTLDEQAILTKKFTKNVKGYDPREVDEFLDLIIADYQNIGQYLSQMDTYIKKLEGQLEAARKAYLELDQASAADRNKKRDLEIEVAALNNRLAGIKESDHVTAENMAYIRRISQLERFFKNKGFTEADLTASENE